MEASPWMNRMSSRGRKESSRSWAAMEASLSMNWIRIWYRKGRSRNQAPMKGGPCQRRSFPSLGRTGKSPQKNHPWWKRHPLESKQTSSSSELDKTSPRKKTKLWWENVPVKGEVSYRHRNEGPKRPKVVTDSTTYRPKVGIRTLWDDRKCLFLWVRWPV